MAYRIVLPLYYIFRVLCVSDFSFILYMVSGSIEFLVRDWQNFDNDWEEELEKHGSEVYVPLLLLFCWNS
jgi:hypothetical protein